MLTASLVSHPQLTRVPTHVQPHHRRRLATPIFAQKEHTGIHDPAGPSGAWGTGENRGRKEAAAKEQGHKLEGEHLAKEDARAGQRTGGHLPGNAGVGDRVAAVNAELAEMADEKADEEYAHMSKAEKLIMEAKAALYAWTKDGVEPL